MDRKLLCFAIWVVTVTHWSRDKMAAIFQVKFSNGFFNENSSISIKISLKFVPKTPFNNIPTLVQIMSWHLPGDKPLSEPMMVSLLTHIRVIRTQWVKLIMASWCHRDVSKMPQVMACCLTAPSHYLKKYFLIISEVHWQSSEGNFTAINY